MITCPETEPQAVAIHERCDYVCGFMFSPQHRIVLLIKKERPAWQAGKYNGAGGKIERGETPTEAMQREFREETGIDHADWTHFATVAGYKDHFCVHFFHATGDISRATSMTDEEVVRVQISNLHDWPLVRGLHWLIWLALEGSYQVVTATDEVFE